MSQKYATLIVFVVMFGLSLTSMIGALARRDSPPWGHQITADIGVSENTNNQFICGPRSLGEQRPVQNLYHVTVVPYLAPYL